jgi:hypothetical protein
VSASTTPEQAQQWVTATLEALASHGMLTDSEPSAALIGRTIPEDRWSADRIATMPPFAPFSPVAEKRYSLLGTCALVRYSHKGQLRLVDAVIGHLAVDSPREPTVVIDLPSTKLDDGYLRTDVYRNGEPVAYASRLSMIGPVIKSVLWQSAINAHDFLFYIHAGVVGTKHGCILLPAQAGSGKSSLTAALVHRGFRYFSDEVALLQRSDFRVPPMPLAICVKSTGWDVMAQFYPNIADLPMHWRDDASAFATSLLRSLEIGPPRPSAISSFLASRSRLPPSSNPFPNLRRWPANGGMSGFAPAARPRNGPAARHLDGRDIVLHADLLVLGRGYQRGNRGYRR